MLSTVLREKQLYEKLSKRAFWLESVNFLGHIVLGQGISVDPRKVEVVEKWLINRGAIILGLSRIL